MLEDLEGGDVSKMTSQPELAGHQTFLKRLVSNRTKPVEAVASVSLLLLCAYMVDYRKHCNVAGNNCSRELAKCASTCT